MNQQSQQKSGIGGCAKFGIGCFAVILIVGIVSGLVVRSYWRTWLGDGAQAVAVQAINDSSLTEEQKQGMIAEVGRLTEAFKNEEVNADDLGNIMNEIAGSPLLVTGMVMFVEQVYVESSGLSDEEKADARRTLQRLARGIFEETIDPRKAEDAAAPLMQTDAQGDQSLKDPANIAPEELQAFLANAKALADEAQVPDEAFEPDIVKEFGDAIDRALQKAGKTLPPANQAESGE